MTNISSIQSLALDLPPSCIAFCPQQPTYFVIGTYYLHAKAASSVHEANSLPNDNGEGDSQKRSGSLILYRLHRDDITLIATEATPDFSVLDIQWSSYPSTESPVLAVATSTGLLMFYHLEHDCDNASLSAFSTKRVSDESTLVLSCIWHPQRADTIAVTLSDGRVCLIRSTAGKGELWAEDSTVTVTDIYQHSLEAWTVAFTSDFEREYLLSGGDDATLQCSRVDIEDETTLLWQDRKSHIAGVTAILPITSELFLTGSYDDHIRLISTLAGRRRVVAELNLGGGVWRLQLLHDNESAEVEVGFRDDTTRVSASNHINLRGVRSPSKDAVRRGCRSRLRSILILASCMHAGTRVLRLGRFEDEDWRLEVLAKFEEHRSMNYGSAVRPSDQATITIVSTSFYDKLLCLWRFSLPDIGWEVQV
ncbi:hypothetical protein BAUCODRAFT_123054 [Baudoinia panamericana UAMH 10762]|uniref:Anaphase-promoting complex subunit 4 WD40 domain-containing protein n=1 Tax=Baudoinia panamericana (strain UAMH 10762) TaxID=717646 RepID=M2LN37_BAUPA|nr:uncharacterized protein BAUCODRAFT_123054 [Baudoinia panamericana UAMH 10762]EMC95757.1 hypothetical protein BAUCODRAFT_123054 [Baudoinia panamericana UAMH 10762]